jgi:regulatory protein
VALLLTDLEARGYLDDARFARAWVESRARSRGVGPERLRAELRARGVDPSLIEAAIGAVFTDPETVAAGALDVARRRLAVLAKRGPGRAAPRLRDYLLRRGYAAGVVARVVRTLCGPDAAGPADAGE